VTRLELVIDDFGTVFEISILVNVSST